MYVLQYWNTLSAKMFSRKKQWYKIGAKTFPSEHLKLQFMLKMGFWLLMLTGNEFWQDFWETNETSSKYELPQVDATIPWSFYCASVSETGYSHLFLRTDLFHSRAYGGLLYINMAAFFLFCTPIWPPWRYVTTICRATGRAAFKTSGNFRKQSLHFIFRPNITP